MDVNEEHVQTLLSMGFPNESDIRKALKYGKNDLSEAVAILTNEHPTTNYDTLDDVEMTDPQVKSKSVQFQEDVYGPALPPSYDEAVDAERSPRAEQESGSNDKNEESWEFPTANLYELEGRVFTESWSIPYKKEESLGICLIAATKLAGEGLVESDQYCCRFIDRCMPECFQKLLTSGAVHRWGREIQEGIYSMLQLLVDLVATRLRYEPVPVGLLHTLAMAFNPETEFNVKNKGQRPDKRIWEEKFGSGQTYANVNQVTGFFKDQYGWLTNLINQFAFEDGFNSIKCQLEKENIDAPVRAALLEPFGNCAEFLHKDVVTDILNTGMELAVKYVQNLKEDDLRDKRVGCVCDMLATMKLLCIHMWPNDVNALDDIRLDIVLRMLKSPHFNARMNSLKELTKLMDESKSTKLPKTALASDKILTWLVEKKVLSIALEGNIDQVQYCDKIKNIVDFLGEQLSVDELTKIWKMQNEETNSVIDNIHAIIAAAGVKFNSQQIEHLFLLIEKSWKIENDKMREKLLSLIGKIGREARIPKTTSRVLELLWDLSHLPILPKLLIEQALDEHLAILNDSFIIKEQIKKNYVVKCVDDIKLGKWVLPALKQLLQIAKNIAKHSYHKAEKGILQELNKNYDIIKQVTNSLMKFHVTACTLSKEKEKPLKEDILVDGRYTHKDYVKVHLSFLQFILQEGSLYLPWQRARDIWDTLVANNDACDWDREFCVEWFRRGISDLEPETQSQLFQKELLKQDPAKLTVQGFTCFKNFFESVNQYDHKLKKQGTNLYVEKLDLIGLSYLWEICLNTQVLEIAESAVELLIQNTYTQLSSRLKRDPVQLHKKFIDECYRRLEMAMIPLGGSAIAQVLSVATRVVTAATVAEAASQPTSSKTANLLSIERLLLLAERYIVTVEEMHLQPRSILPHGASFHGLPMHLFIICESPKAEFTVQVHSNESIASIRSKIAENLKHSPEQIQIGLNDKVLSPGRDQKLLHQLDIEDHQVLSVRAFSSTVSTVRTGTSREIPESVAIEQDSGSAKHSFDLEQEKMLPGVAMAQGGQVFEMLYQLADLDEPRITNRARSLLKLIPTDPSVQDSLDSIGQKVFRQPSPDDLSPRLSPRSSPRKFTPTPVPAASQTPRSKDPKDVLKSMFNAVAPQMTTFRMLYNLEVLSSKLMPTVPDVNTFSSGKVFCEEFLNAGGLNLVVNVLQQDAIPQEVDYETRQGCYAISLQLLRYLLCEDISGETIYSSPDKRRGSSISASPGSSGPLSIEVTPTASRAIQHMSVNDFTETVACFMRAAWAAAAGKLHLASSSQPLKENSSMTSSIYSSSSRSRQSSTGSTTSSGSEGDGNCLHAGVCVKHTQISTKDTNIAKEALELLVTCLQLRSTLLATFYSLPCASDFIIDILVGSTQTQIRDVALDQFYLLSQTEIVPEESIAHQQTPHQFMLQTLLKARLPFWVTSSSTRGASHRLLNQCTQYFELRCRLLGHLTMKSQKRLMIDVPSMLEDETGWLSNFVPSENSDVKDTDNTLVAGHLKLIKTLLTCEGIDKREYGKGLVQDILYEFLFPSSKLIMEDTSSQDLHKSIQNFIPKCSSSESKVSAYELLTELADGCFENLKEICDELVSMHHHVKSESTNLWDFMPPVDSRSLAGFVGLKNGGATCYMNAVIQQIYMAPTVPETLLAIDEEEIEEDSVFSQIQYMFGHLLESKLQYYVPERFWKVFKLWGQSVNIREQQDAFDFYQALIDQVDEQLKILGKEEVFKKKLQGVFFDQKICKDCPHRYEREEVFLSLNVTVKNETLQDSLDQFVQGNLLEGDNAYFCEKCGEKRNALKRMCIKTLPPLLCIQLKRFGYDWEANRALKFDDYFKFPWVLDMEPYTADGMARREEQEKQGNEEPMPPAEPGSTREEPMMVVTNSNTTQINYELVGVVVHSGQANAGHYYSFIKDRRGNYMSNPNKGKWYKFNDNNVEEFEMTDAALEAECFGGTYKAKVYDQSSSYPEERLRYWNGYLLFYERMEEVRTPVSAKKTKVSIKRLPHEKMSVTNRNDSFVELTELVHKGDKRGIFTDKMPARIQQLVRDENLKFMKNRDVYDVDYFTFVRNLVNKNSSQVNHERYSEMCLQSLHIAVEFLCNTYFRTKKKLRSDIGEWVATIEKLVQRCKEACVWLIEYFSCAGKSHIKPFLLECPTREIRLSFARILERTMANFFHHGGVSTHKCFDELLETILCMLNKDVPDNIKTCTQYFWVLSMYVQMGTKACSHMFGKNAFGRLMTFLLGANAPNQVDQESTMRRWSSVQARDFGPLHTTLATLILNCDITSFRSDTQNFPIRNPTTVVPQIYLKMSVVMEQFVFGKVSSRYLREVVMALREVSGSLSTIIDMVVYCSFCNAEFTMMVLKNIMTQYASAPSNELKGLFDMLLQLMLLEDPLQMKRLQCIIDGYVDEADTQYEGMLAVIKSNHMNDSRRSYQCIKFLVNLANKCQVAKDYLMQSPTKWQWAVNWLKRKMTEYHWSSTSTSTVISNADSDSRSFQRTISAQDTLEEATALLTELEAHTDMEVNGSGSDGEQSGSVSSPKSETLEEEGEEKL